MKLDCLFEVFFFLFSHCTARGSGYSYMHTLQSLLYFSLRIAFAASYKFWNVVYPFSFLQFVIEVTLTYNFISVSHIQHYISTSLYPIMCSPSKIYFPYITMYLIPSTHSTLHFDSPYLHVWFGLFIYFVFVFSFIFLYSTYE